MAQELPGGTVAEVLDHLIASLDPAPYMVRAEVLDPGTIGDLMIKVRRLQRLAHAIVASLTEVAAQHAQIGAGPMIEQVLSSDGAVDKSTVVADLGRAQVVSLFPEVGAAVRNGAALPANVDCLARQLSKVSETERASLVGFDGPIAERVTHHQVGTFRKYLQRLINTIRKDHGIGASERERAAAGASVSAKRDRTGYVLRGEWETERGTAIYNAVRTERRELLKRLGASELTPDQLTAQAVSDLIARGAAVNPSTGQFRPGVVINVLTDYRTMASGPHPGTIAETFDGQNLALETIGRLCCDAVLRKLDTAPDAHVNASRTVRTATVSQRAALRTLYPCCPITGAPWSMLEIHHVIPYETRRETRLPNLLPISSRIHHLVHEGGWKLTLSPDRTIHLYRPNGTLDRTVPPPTAINLSSADHAAAA
ncbi:MAG: HNH endonuclease [Acidimicrobiales bacterium]|nr:HNH endonuclease [Acidimicrobiales bacterium]